MLSMYLAMLETQDDKRKFECLYHKYSKIMISVAYDHLHDYRLAEDCVQESFISVAKHMKNVGDVDSLQTKAYVLTITRAVAVNMFKKDCLEKSHITCSDDSSEQTTETLENDYFHKEELKSLTEMIMELPDEYRDVMILRYGHGLDYAAIADIVKITAPAARKRVQRAKALLKKQIKSDDSDLL